MATVTKNYKKLITQYMLLWKPTNSSDVNSLVNINLFFLNDRCLTRDMGRCVCGSSSSLDNVSSLIKWVGGSMVVGLGSSWSNDIVEFYKYIIRK